MKNLFICLILTVILASMSFGQNQARSKQAGQPPAQKRYAQEKKDIGTALLLGMVDGLVLSSTANFLAVRAIQDDLQQKKGRGQELASYSALCALFPPLGLAYAGYYTETTIKKSVLHFSNRTVAVFFTNIFAAGFLFLPQYLKNQPTRIMLMSFGIMIKTVTGIIQTIAPPFDAANFNQNLKLRYQISWQLWTRREHNLLDLMPASTANAFGISIVFRF